MARQLKPAASPEELEGQLISAATRLAQRQLEEGTASAQVITHYLKLGSSRERLEQERIKADTQLAQARVEAAASQVRIEELYGEALQAMISYRGGEQEVLEEWADDTEN